ncbi:hypothetical protein QWZ16_03640 [Vibrio ostreicida]|uniref:Uncharacterized protein n=1 Tax=Vibrio ostreicida TaxID=526588 RepID=A0ABT8BPM3_9VIBR|nr:hypothetical protein [Vibrio ostreicida]MDN3608836.1 hypothetical protein [Vibrio ostreicida]
MSPQEEVGVAIACNTHNVLPDQPRQPDLTFRFNKPPSAVFLYPPILILSHSLCSTSMYCLVQFHQGHCFASKICLYQDNQHILKWPRPENPRTFFHNTWPKSIRIFMLNFG